jgi:vitamin B12 transporter
LSGGVHAGASLAYQRSDGFPPVASSTQARGYRNGSMNLQLSAAANDRWELSAQLWNAQGNSEYLGYDDAFNYGPLDQDYRNTALAASARFHHDRWSWKTTLSRAADDIRQKQFRDFARTNRNTLDSQLTAQLTTRQELSAGAVLSREDSASLVYGTSFDVRTTTRLFYLQDQLHLGANEVLLAVGNAHHESFGNHTTWNAEYNRAVGSQWHLSAAAGTAFRAPDSTDRFGFGGNPTLDPERSRQYELGLRWRSGGQSLLLSAFDTHIDSLIVFVYDPISFGGTNENVARARIRGVELSYELNRAPWSLNAAATLQNPRDESDGSVLLRRAREHFDLRLARQSGRFTASATLIVSGERDDFGFPSNVRLPGYALLNAGLDYQLLPEWSVQLHLDNALDRRYQLVSGYNTPRRGVLLGTRYRFK